MALIPRATGARRPSVCEDLAAPSIVPSELLRTKLGQSPVVTDDHRVISQFSGTRIPRGRTQGVEAATISTPRRVTGAPLSSGNYCKGKGKEKRNEQTKILAFFWPSVLLFKGKDQEENVENEPTSFCLTLRFII
jgi:hypothetical protein